MPFKIKEVSLFGNSNMGQNIPNFDLYKISDLKYFDISAEFNKHATLEVEGVMSKALYYAFKSLTKGKFKFIQVKMTGEDILEDINFYKGSETLFIGVCDEIIAEKVDDITYIIKVKAFSLTKFLDLKESFNAISDTSLSASDISNLIVESCDDYRMGNRSIIKNNCINNDMTINQPLGQFMLWHRETAFEFLMRYAASINSNITPNFFDESASVNIVGPLHLQDSINTHKVYPKHARILSVFSATNTDFFKYDRQAMAGYHGINFESQNAMFMLGHTLQFTNTCFKGINGIALAKIPNDTKYMVSSLNITLLNNNEDNNNLLKYTARCISEKGLFKSSYTNPKIHGLTLFANVMSLRNNGVVLSFGKKYNNPDGIKDLDVNDTTSFDNVQKSRYKKYYKYLAYLIGNYTNSNKVLSQASSDPMKIIFGDLEKRNLYYCKMSSDLARSSLNIKASNYYDTSLWDKDSMHIFGVVGTNMDVDGSGVYENVVTGNIVKVFFPSEDETTGYALPVPHIFEQDVSVEYKKSRDSAIDVPDPYSMINGAQGPASISTMIFPPVTSFSSKAIPSALSLNKGDKSNPLLDVYNITDKTYNSYKGDDLNKLKDATVFGRKGDMQGYKLTNMKSASIENYDSDSLEVNQSSMFLDGENGNILFHSTNKVSLNANNKVRIKAPKVVIISGESDTLSNNGSSKISLDKESVSYTSPIKHFNSN